MHLPIGTNEGNGMATKTMNVKVSTSKLIKALETALAKRQKDSDDFDKAVKEYEKEYEVFTKSLVSLIGTKKLVLSNVRLRNDYRQSGTELAEFEFAMDKSIKVPERPQRKQADWNIANAIEEIKNAIAILKMTDDEFVSTSTYKGVAQYL